MSWVLAPGNVEALEASMMYTNEEETIKIETRHILENCAYRIIGGNFQQPMLVGKMDQGQMRWFTCTSTS